MARATKKLRKQKTTAKAAFGKSNPTVAVFAFLFIVFVNRFALYKC